MKVLCCGLAKTGTTSIMAYLNGIGIKTTPNPRISFLDNELKNKGALWTEYTIPGGYTGFQDLPYSINFRYFHDNVKDCKFILTVRNPNEWFESIKSYHKRPNSSSKPWIKYLFGHEDITEHNKKEVIDRYNKYNKDVIEYFEVNNKEILVINLEDDNKKLGEKISNYLGIDKIIEFPHKNKQHSYIL